MIELGCQPKRPQEVDYLLAGDHAVIGAFPGHYEVIQYRNPQDFACLDQTLGYLKVIGRWLKGTAGVIVGNNDNNG